jgi:hypothetical protein
VGRSDAFFALGMFGPTLAAVATQRIFAGNWKAVHLWKFVRSLLAVARKLSIGC